MPIEIRELHIRVAVTAPESASPAGPGAPAGAPTAAAGAGGADLEGVVAACVERVMQVLRDRAER